MATSGRREVDLALRVSTLGEDSIGRLERDVRALAKQGGDAAPEFERLADEIARLGGTAQQLQEFDRLSQEIGQLAEAQQRAASSADILGADLVELSAATERARVAEQASLATLRQKQQQLQLARDAYQQFRLETDAASKKTAEYDRTAREHRTTIAALNRELRPLAANYRETTAATTAAVTAEDRLSKQHAKAQGEVDKLGRSINDTRGTLTELRTALEGAGLSTEDLARAQATLVGSMNAAAKAATDLENTRQAAIQRAKEQAEAEKLLAEEQRKQAEAAKDAAKAVKDSFDAVGTPSVAALREEIARVRSSMEFLRTNVGLTGKELDQAMRSGNARIRELEREIRGATGSLTTMDRAAIGIKSTWAQVAAGFGAGAIAGGIVDGIYRMAGAFVDAQKQIEGLRLGLNTIYKDSELTGRQIDFLRATADRAGVSVGSISQAFIKFSASTQAANIPLAQTNELFGAVTQAAGTLGLSGDKVSHILDALSQMAAKGVVSMEELRQQLGDSLPGAFALTAKGLGITEQQLIKLVESGGLAARDLFPALTKSLKEMGGEVNTLSASWERFKNVLTTTSQAAGDSGWRDVMTSGLNGISAAMEWTAKKGVMLSETFFFLGRGAGAAAAAASEGQPIWEAIRHEWEEGNKRIAAFARSMDGGADAAENAAGKQRELTNEQRLANAQAEVAAASQQALGTATAQAGQSASEAAREGWVRLKTALVELEETQKLNIEAMDKSEKATKIQGEAMRAMAQLRGSEIEQLRVSAETSAADTSAAERSATARQALVDTLTRQRESLLAVIGTSAEERKAREQELKVIDDKLVKANAELDVSRQEVAASQATTAARQLAAQAYRDNSMRVEEFRQAMLLSQQALREQELLEINGKGNKDRLAAATTAASQAEGLYRDAVSDANAAAERNVLLVRSQNDIKIAALNVAMQEKIAAEASAKAMGDEYGVRQAQIGQKEIAIAQAKQNVAAIRAEAAALDVAIERRITELQVAGQWTPAAETEIQLRREQVRLKLLEADAAEKGISAMDRELSQLRLGIDGKREAKRASDDLHGSLERERGGHESNTGAIQKETDALYQNLLMRNRIKDRTAPGGGDPDKEKIAPYGYTADGFIANKDGSAAGQFNNSLPVNLAHRLMQTGGKGMSTSELEEAIKQATNAYRDMEAFRNLNPGAMSMEYFQSTTALMNAANLAKQRLSATRSAAQNPEVDPLGVSGAPARKAGGSRTININLGGRNTSVNVASQQDGDALVALLRQLESSSRSST